MMASLEMFKLFDDGFYIEHKNIRSVELYILSNLNSVCSPSKELIGRKCIIYVINFILFLIGEKGITYCL